MSTESENIKIESTIITKNDELDIKNNDGDPENDLKPTQSYEDEEDELALNALSQRSLLNIDESAKSQSDLFLKIYESTNRALDLKICYKLEELVDKSIFLPTKLKQMSLI
jgi:hypothetical protein